MKVTPVKTDKITADSHTIYDVLDKHLSELNDGNVIAITSKVVAICEGRVVPINQANIEKLVEQEADYYLPASINKYGFSFSILHNTLIPRAGIDESNGNGNYILWPKDPQKTANDIRKYLKKRFGLKYVGIVITDSTARPLHWGTEGIAIRYSGFSPTNNYIGQPDLFGRPYKVSKANVVDALAAAAALVMGEGSEQTPIALIENVPFVDFHDHDPTKKELGEFYLSHMNDDLFEPFLKNMGWKKGKK